MSQARLSFAPQFLYAQCFVLFIQKFSSYWFNLDHCWSHSGSFSVGVVSTVVPDSAHKLFIGGLPNYLNDDQVCYNGIVFHLLTGSVHWRVAELSIDWAELSESDLPIILHFRLYKMTYKTFSCSTEQLLPWFWNFKLLSSLVSIRKMHIQWCLKVYDFLYFYINMTQKNHQILKWQKIQSDKWAKKYILCHLFNEKNYPVLHICEWQKYVNLCFQYLVRPPFAAITAAKHFL